jgi:hypothetical protein
LYRLADSIQQSWWPVSSIGIDTQVMNSFDFPLGS